MYIYVYESITLRSILHDDFEVIEILTSSAPRSRGFLAETDRCLPFLRGIYRHTDPTLSSSTFFSLTLDFDVQRLALRRRHPDHNSLLLEYERLLTGRLSHAGLFLFKVFEHLATFFTYVCDLKYYVIVFLRLLLFEQIQEIASLFFVLLLLLRFQGGARLRLR